MGFVFLGWDESDWAPAFAIITFGIATYIAYRANLSNRQFILSQIDDKDAVLYSYAERITALYAGAGGEPISPPEFGFDHILSDIRAIGRISGGIKGDDKTRLLKAEARLVSVMDKAGMKQDANKLDAIFKSFLR